MQDSFTATGEAVAVSYSVSKASDTGIAKSVVINHSLKTMKRRSR